MSPDLWAVLECPAWMQALRRPVRLILNRSFWNNPGLLQMEHAGESPLQQNGRRSTARRCLSKGDGSTRDWNQHHPLNHLQCVGPHGSGYPQASWISTGIVLSRPTTPQYDDVRAAAGPALPHSLNSTRGSTHRESLC